MTIPPNQLETILTELENWLARPRKIYQTEIRGFAVRLPPEEILEAVMIAKAKFPDGGLSGFKYFCGVCHRKIENHEINETWDTSIG